jgi:RND family efflux transporter MFP subunit
MVKKIVISSILLIALGFSLGCGKIKPGNTESGTEETIRAAVAVVRIAPSTDYYEAVGTVKAETASTLSGKLMGTIKTVNVREGDRITKGQLLILIDDRQVSAQLKQAKAALEEASQSEAAAISARDAAKAGNELAQATYKRYLKLIEDSAASRQEFEEIEMRSRQADAALKQSEAALEAAKERVKEAEAGVTSADVSRKDAEISAPFDGIVTARMVDVGDLSSPGTPFLNVEKLGTLEVEAIIPEDCISLITPQQDLDVVMPILQDKPIKGKVKAIINAADPQSRTFIIKVDLPEVAGMHSGMFARINIPRGAENMLLIPSSALVLQGQLTGIFVLDDEQTAHFRIIRTGRKAGDLVEVISGVKDGTYYVVSPPPDLKDGMKVEAAL